MEQDEDFNFDRELLDEDQDNELFYNFGDFEESQDLEDVNVALIITCLYLISFIFPKPKNILIQNFEN